MAVVEIIDQVDMEIAKVDIVMEEEVGAEIMVEITTIMETIMQAPDQIGGKIKHKEHWMLILFFLYLKKDLFFSQNLHMPPSPPHTYIHTQTQQKK
jgi:hypothetical protein